MSTRASGRGGGPESHPEELLAAFVDDALDPEQGDDVERHLGACEACSEEVVLAEAARAAVGSLPEEAMPERTAEALARAVDGEAARRRSRAPTRSRPSRRSSTWLAGLAAAAVIVGLLAVALPTLSGSGGSRVVAGAASGAGGANAEPAPQPAGPPLIERQGVDYDAERVAALAASGAATPATATAAAGSAERSADAAGVQGADEALACVRRWTSSAEQAVPFRIIEASYEGKPAYLGLAYQTAGPGRDRVLVWVLAQRDCSLISFTQRAV